MTYTQNTMTWDQWRKIPERDREKLRDLSDLSPQLVGLEGKRVEVTDIFGRSRRFWVGKSTGWKPCHLEIKTTRSMGGIPADTIYRSVSVVRG
jgi:hypothetical protein